MAIFGCHSCNVDLSKYTSYEESPCATCKLCKEYTNTHRAAMFDSGNDNEDVDNESDDIENDQIDPNSIYTDQSAIDPTADTSNIEILKTVIESQIFVAASNIILKLVKLAKSNPVMFEIVIKKMQYPYMSYSEIGNSMSPKCSKQNILYHLKHAIELFPEISTALLTDTRFSAGRYALQTVANKHRQDVAKQRVQGILYGDTNPAFKAQGLSEINKILAAPFMVSDEALNFNPYLQDELE